MNAAKTIVALVAITSSAIAMAAEPDLPQPPPYGAYFWLPVVLPGNDPNYGDPIADRIAQHYGYKDRHDAEKDCVRKTEAAYCSDPVAHRRHESPEIAKFGFKSWRDAVGACNRNWKNDFGPINGNAKTIKGAPLHVTYCHADPFLALRLARK